MDYISGEKEGSFSAKDVHDYLETRGITANLSTIYRNLDKLVDKNILVKFRSSKSDSGLYRVVDSNGIVVISACHAADGCSVEAVPAEMAEEVARLGTACLYDLRLPDRLGAVCLHGSECDRRISFQSVLRFRSAGRWPGMVLSP